jgi:alanine racemase
MEGSTYNGRAWVEIDLDSLRKNYRALKDKIGETRKVLVAVKADAYGHGAVEISRTLQQEGVDMVGVASVDEAVELKRGGIDCPIVVLSPTTFDFVPVILKNGFRSNVSNFQYAQSLSAAALRMDTRAKVHVEIDTGMGRTGVPWAEALDFVRKTQDLGGIELEGIFTHFAVAEENREYTDEQMSKFFKVLHQLETNGIVVPLKHCANSAGILHYPHSYLNMVRPGLMLYGLFPNSTPRTIDIRPIMSFKTRVVHIQRIPSGNSISYGRRFFTQRDSIIATISVGYGDGFSRSLSNRGEVIIRGKRAKIVGTVCMDLTMVDCSDISGIQLGDEVTLIGRDGLEEMTPDELANLVGTISYEVTSSIGPRVPRIFVSNGLPSGIKSLLGHEDCLLHSKNG